MAVKVTTKRPDHWRTQFRDGAPTKGADCGVWAFLNALDVVTDGAIDVGGSPRDGREAVEETREWMAAPEGGPTSTDDWYRAWTHPQLAATLAVVGLEPPAVSRLSGAPWERVRDHLSAGRVVMLCVDYGVLRRSPAPVDSSSFAGGHAVTFSGYTNDIGIVWTVVMDSLLDGPRTVRQSWYRNAAGRFGTRPWGVGKVEALSIAPAKSVQPQQPQAGDLGELVDRLGATLDSGTAQIAEIRRLIAQGRIR